MIITTVYKPGTPLSNEYYRCREAILSEAQLLTMEKVLPQNDLGWYD